MIGSQRGRIAKRKRKGDEVITILRELQKW